jgi:hypothetical protein
MNRNQLVKFGAIVIILSLFLSIFVGAVASFASDRAQGQISVIQGPSPDIDGDGVINNEDPDLDGDGIDNGLDPDIDGDGSENGQDGNPTSTNDVDSVPPRTLESKPLSNGAAESPFWLSWAGSLPFLIFAVDEEPQQSVKF